MCLLSNNKRQNVDEIDRRLSQLADVGSQLESFVRQLGDFEQTLDDSQRDVDAYRDTLLANADLDLEAVRNSYKVRFSSRTSH